jgi:hypothetical protein
MLKAKCANDAEHAIRDHFLKVHQSTVRDLEAKGVWADNEMLATWLRLQWLAFQQALEQQGLDSASDDPDGADPDEVGH